MNRNIWLLSSDEAEHLTTFLRWSGTFDYFPPKFAAIRDFRLLDVCCFGGVLFVLLLLSITVLVALVFSCSLLPFEIWGGELIISVDNFSTVFTGITSDGLLFIVSSITVSFFFCGVFCCFVTCKYTNFNHKKWKNVPIGYGCHCFQLN